MKTTRSTARFPRLIALPVLLVVVLGIGGTLLALFPSEERLKEIAMQRNTDVLSIAYLKLLLRTHPNDNGIRFALAASLAAIGKGEEAKTLIHPFLNKPGKEGSDARAAMIEVDWAMFNALPATDVNRAAIATALTTRIEQLSKESIGPAELQRLAQISKSMGHPDLAAQLYRTLAKTDVDNRQHWREEAARAFYESGAPLEAAHEFEAIALDNQNKPATQRNYILKALDAYLAADKGNDAMKLVDASADKFNKDKAFMQRLVAIALSQNKPARAQQLGRQLLALSPDDPIVLDQQIAVELAASDLAAALALAERQVQLTPKAPNIKQRTRLAQIAEWSNQPKVALEQWAFMARLNPSGDEMTHALTMASQLEEDALWLELATLRDPSQALKPDNEATLLAIVERKKANKLLIAYLKNYLDRHPSAINLWKILSAALEQQGDIKGALALWRRLEPKYISAVASRSYQSAILLRAKRPTEALALLEAVRSQAKPTDIDYWTMLGDAALECKQPNEALVAYRTAWDNGSKQVLVAERLITLYNTNHDASNAIAVGRGAYARLGEPRWLLLAMDSASQGGRWDELRELVETAKGQESKFQNSEMYWLLQAHLAEHEGHRSIARDGYLKALAINPSSVSAKVALVWLEVNGGDKKQLNGYLKKWRTEAQNNPDFWGAYAAGYLYLKKPKESLPWFQRKARQQPDDYLWMLSYADALAKAGREDQAWRIRQHAFERLSPLLTDDKKEDDKALRIAYAKLVGDLEGAQAGDRELQKLLARGVDDPEVYELLVASSLSQENTDSAREWLLKAHAKRLNLPAWQSLAVALADHDNATLQQLADDKDNSLSVQDRVAALRKLNRNDEAYTLVKTSLLTPEDRDNKALQQLNDELTMELSRRIEGEFGERRFQNLNITSSRVAGSFPLAGGRADLQLTHNRLSSNSSDLVVDGFRNENDLSMTGKFPIDDGSMRLNVGVNQRHDHSLAYGRFEWLPQLSKTVSARLEASVNNLSDETPQLRAIGAVDRVAAGVSVNLTDREYARVGVAGQHFHTRDRTTLGNGYKVEGELGTTIFKKIPIWQARLSGSLEKNHLASSLPTNLLGTVLPLGTGVDSVISPSFSTVGVGTTIGFGHKEGLLFGPYGLFDAWVGRQWPGNELAYSLRASTGRPVFGPDLLSIEGFYSTNVQGGGTSGSANRGAAIVYKYRF